jgi:hypothetical protein
MTRITLFQFTDQTSSDQDLFPLPQYMQTERLCGEPDLSAKNVMGTAHTSTKAGLLNTALNTATESTWLHTSASYLLNKELE